MKKSWKRIVRMLALLTAAAALFAMPALAELAGDLAGLVADQNHTDDQEFVDDPNAPEPTPEPEHHDELIVGYLAAQNASVNPLYCQERDLVNMNQLVFESLVTLDDEQKPVPMLADSWEHEENRWTFTLRSGITFHNGAELTAYDVEATYDAFVRNTNNPWSPRLSTMISDMQAEDDRTLLVLSSTNSILTLYALTFPVMSTGTINDDLPRGTGPYWYTDYVYDDHVRLESNPLWWQKTPTIASILFQHFADIGEETEALQTHQIDLLTTRSTTAALLRKLSNLTSMDYGTRTFELLVPNLSSSSAMSDLTMRRAVMYAIDRATLASNAYLDMAIQSEVPVLPGTWLYESQSAVYYYSPEHALGLLYDLGWRDMTGDTYLNKVNGIKIEELTLRLITCNEGGNSIRQNAANLIAASLNRVGIKVEIEVLASDKVRSRMRDRDFDLALIGVNLSEVPILQPLLGSGGALNYNRYSDADMDALLSAVGYAEDESTVRQLYSDIQKKVSDDLPIMGLLFRTGTVLSTRSLGGLSGIRELNAFRGLQYLQ